MRKCNEWHVGWLDDLNGADVETVRLLRQIKHLGVSGMLFVRAGLSRELGICCGDEFAIAIAPEPARSPAGGLGAGFVQTGVLFPQPGMDFDRGRASAGEWRSAPGSGVAGEPSGGSFNGR